MSILNFKSSLCWNTKQTTSNSLLHLETVNFEFKHIRNCLNIYFFPPCFNKKHTWAVNFYSKLTAQVCTDLLFWEAY